MTSKSSASTITREDIIPLDIPKKMQKTIVNLSNLHTVDWNKRRDDKG